MNQLPISDKVMKCSGIPMFFEVFRAALFNAACYA